MQKMPRNRDTIAFTSWPLRAHEMTRPTRVPAKYARRKNVVHFKDAFSFSSQYTQVGTRAIRLPSDVDEVPSFTEAHDAVLLTCQN
ncbi:MAG: hypothetical protein ACJ8BW_25005 [Ktedonobacteraceae bacterium]